MNYVEPEKSILQSLITVVLVFILVVVVSLLGVRTKAKNDLLREFEEYRLESEIKLRISESKVEYLESLLELRGDNK